MYPLDGLIPIGEEEVGLREPAVGREEGIIIDFEIKELMEEGPSIDPAQAFEGVKDRNREPLMLAANLLTELLRRLEDGIAIERGLPFRLAPMAMVIEA